MAYEIINNPQINPQRLYALVRLITTNPGIEEEEIFSLLQPKPLNTNQLACKEILDAAVKTGLVKGDVNHTYKSNFRITQIETYSLFRMEMQKLLLGAENEGKDNYLLNLFIAWYAVKNVDELTKNIDLKEMAVDFNRELFPGSEERALNYTKLGGMDDWVVFLGYGWKINNYFLVPDATLRLELMLDEILPVPEEITFGEFMKRLSSRCPELDRGVLFEKCWQAIHGNNPRTNDLSLMLSTALRTLNNKQRIELIYSQDTRDTWMLYPDMGHPNERVTHISAMRKIA